MSIRFQCPECGRSFSVGEEHIGKKAKCRCGSKFIVPSTSSRSEPPKPVASVQEVPPVPAAAQEPQPVSTAGDERGADGTRLLWRIGVIVMIGIAAALGVAGGMYIAGMEKAELRDQISFLKERQQKLLAKLQKNETAELQESRKQSSDSGSGRSVSSAERNPRTTGPDLPVPPYPRPVLQKVPVINSGSGRRAPDTPTQSAFQNTGLIIFHSGERVSEIPVSSGQGPFGIPQFKANKAPPGCCFYIVESRINTLDWPKEKIEFDGKEGVNIKSTDVILETADGQLIHPSFASFGMTEIGTNKRGFAPGPLRNIALVFGQGAVNDKPAGIMQIYVARPGPREDLIEVENGGAIDPNRKAFSVYFAFSIPVNAEVKAVGLSNNSQGGNLDIK
jgi:DNA-directed RNA polymerase subunit RPC12/RpoP